MTTEHKLNTQRVALVTGGSRGIGRAIVTRLSEAGFAVAFSYRSDTAAAASLCADIAAAGGCAVAIRTETADASVIESMVQEAEDKLGGVDVLVCNAGIGRVLTTDAMTLSDWRHVLETNLDSAFIASQRVIGGMRSRRYGRLVYLSSIAARNGGVISPGYAASKAGMEGLMHYYAAHLASFGITSNAVAPAFIATDMLAKIELPPAASVPLGRFGDPQEVADAVDLLVRNGFITGQTLHVNAGRFMT